MPSKTKLWPWILAGLVLRCALPFDIEYKTDEAYMVEMATRFLHGEISFPWLGVSSGVHLKNPGLSVWLFLALGKLSQIFGVAPNPVIFSLAVGLMGTLSFVVIMQWILPKLSSEELPWWQTAVILGCVNPLLVLFERKTWAQSTLPLFCSLAVALFVRRDDPKTGHRATFWLALFLGFLGQIHMSGFFWAASVLLYFLLFERKQTHWVALMSGFAAALPTLFPWFVEVYKNAHSNAPSLWQWQEVIQFKFPVFFISDGLGLHLGNALGVLNGNGTLEQLRAFLEYPVLGGSPTYLVGFLHLALIATIARLLLRLVRRRSQLNMPQSHTRALFFITMIYGVLISLTGIRLRRYYLLITFPLEFVFMARLFWLAFNEDLYEGARRWSRYFAFSLLGISICFLAFVRQNGGSARGDFGVSYRIQLERGTIAKSRE